MSYFLNYLAYTGYSVVTTIDICAEGNWLIQVSAYFCLLKKVFYIKCYGKLGLVKINTKMPTRTKSVEMNKIMTNSEIYLHRYLCESSQRLQNWKKQPTKVLNKKGALKSFTKLTGKHLCSSPAKVFSCQFYEFLRTPFLQTTTGRLLLMNRLDD